MINPNIKKQYPVIKMPNGHPVSATMYNRNTSQGVVYTNNEEIINTDLAANLSTTSTVVANINITHSIRSDLSATADVSDATITKGISLESSISTDNIVSANTLVSKLLESNVTSTGTLAAELTVGGAFDADAQAFFNRVTTAGGTLSATEQNAVNTLVIGMKADGIWTKMKAIYPMVGGGAANPAAACAQNLKSSSFTGTFTNGWTFASTGVTPNKTTSCFFDTKFGMNIIGVNSNCMGFYTRTNLIEGASEMGTDQNYNMGANFQSFGAFARNLGGNIIGYVNTDTRGFYNNSRILSTEYKYFKNNTTLATIIQTSTAPIVSYNIALGGEMLVGNLSVRVPSSKQFSFAFIGDGLNVSENSLYYTRVQAFQTTLNRQV